MNRAPFDRIASPSYLGDLPARPLDELRALRAECRAVEDAVSFLRRMVQGNLDIVRAERRRRAMGQPSDLDALVRALPETLGDRITSPGRGRLPQTLGPGDGDPTLLDELDAICPHATLAALPELGEGELAALEARLAGYERSVSDQRRLLFDRLDALSGELTRRYRTGEASVESLLS